MSKGVNKVIIVGNLGKEPAIHAFGNGGKVARLNVATSEIWTDKESGQKQERTEWHHVVYFGKLAEVCEKLLRSGSKIYVEGKLETKKYTDKTGVERYQTQINGYEMQLLDSKKASNDEVVPMAVDYFDDDINF